MIHLSVSEVGVASKQDSDITWCLSHLLHHHSQLFHSLLCMVFTALQVGCHQKQLLAFKFHLISKRGRGRFTPSSVHLPLPGFYFLYNCHIEMFQDVKLI